MKNLSRTIRWLSIVVLMTFMYQAMATYWCAYYAAINGVTTKPEATCTTSEPACGGQCVRFTAGSTPPPVCYGCDVAQFYGTCNLSNPIILSGIREVAPCSKGIFYGCNCGTFNVDDPYALFLCWQNIGAWDRMCLL
jgi:hypothetical protein